MDAVTPVNPSAVAADPTDDECPGCGAIVQASILGHLSRSRRGGAGDAGGCHVTADADPDLLAWIVLSRVNDGGVIRQGDDYLDHGMPTPGYLARPFAELTDTGALALADPDSARRQQVTITDAGHARYAQLRNAARDH